MPKIGLIARTITKGNEYDMVYRYIKHIMEKYENLKDKHIAIFVEPLIDTGYPDIVIVEYYVSRNLLFNENRLKLSIQELKLLFHIQKNKNTSLLEIERLLGFPLDEVKKSVLKLESCDLVHVSKKGNYVRNIPINSYSRIKKIISIEAKLDKWSEAIKQAERNTRFATESYILMNKGCCSNSILSKCKELGIGIILVNGAIQTKLKSEKRSFPVSFTSLVFNEWIFKARYYQEAKYEYNGPEKKVYFCRTDKKRRAKGSLQSASSG